MQPTGALTDCDKPNPVSGTREGRKATPRSSGMTMRGLARLTLVIEAFETLVAQRVELGSRHTAAYEHLEHYTIDGEPECAQSVR